MNLIRLVKIGLQKAGIRIPESYINKFSLTGVVFIIWLALFDSYSLIERYQLSRTIARLEDEKISYIESIDKALSDKVDLEKDKEKFAREKYYMHKQNEEVFIVEPKKR